MFYQKKLKELRKSRKVTQLELAELLEITQSTYSKYERGERDLSITHLIKLCDFYEVTSDYILGRTEEK